jgi:metallo-beta-lactamase class B
MVLVVCLLPVLLRAKTAQTLINNPDWTKPFPPFRMIGNIYWVGTYDLSTYLITTPEGHILINTGLSPTVTQIAANIAQLGFKVADIKILTATHGHFDHVAGLARLKQLTGHRWSCPQTMRRCSRVVAGATFAGAPIPRRLSSL